MTRLIDHGPRITRGWVLHPDLKSDRDRRDGQRALDEAVALAHALPGFEVHGADVVPLAKPQRLDASFAAGASHQDAALLAGAQHGVARHVAASARDPALMGRLAGVLDRAICP